MSAPRASRGRWGRSKCGCRLRALAHGVHTAMATRRWEEPGSMPVGAGTPAYRSAHLHSTGRGPGGTPGGLPHIPYAHPPRRQARTAERRPVGGRNRWAEARAGQNRPTCARKKGYPLCAADSRWMSPGYAGASTGPQSSHRATRSFGWAEAGGVPRIRSDSSTANRTVEPRIRQHGGKGRKAGRFGCKPPSRNPGRRVLCN